MLESQAVVETQALPDLQLPICRPLIHTRALPGEGGASPVSSPLYQHKGWSLGLRLGCTVTPMDLQPTALQY